MLRFEQFATFASKTALGRYVDVTMHTATDLEIRSTVG